MTQKYIFLIASHKNINTLNKSVSAFSFDVLNKCFIVTLKCESKSMHRTKNVTQLAVKSIKSFSFTIIFNVDNPLKMIEKKNASLGQDDGLMGDCHQQVSRFFQTANMMPNSIKPLQTAIDQMDPRALIKVAMDKKPIGVAFGGKTEMDPVSRVIVGFTFAPLNLKNKHATFDQFILKKDAA
jgi:hypothetical protein